VAVVQLRSATIVDDLERRPQRRGQMNLSRWDVYSEDQKVELLTKVGVEVINHRMPLPKYLNLHPQARLSNDDVAQLYTWMQGERRRLRASIQSKSRALAD